MPNKDSFTFSDKLRKSKSEPLSKRLPSIVGGKNTQKRTLVQRAQRDLPFILVAALALLLLPFLSRNGSDDIAGTGDIQWNSALEDAPSFAEGGYNDIQPSGAMTDPLDLILRPRSAVEAVGTPSDPTKSAYGSSESSSKYGTSGRGRGYGGSYGTDTDSSGSSSYSRTTQTSKKTPASTDYDTRSQYDKTVTKKVTKPSATGTYGKSTKPSVRKSFERKATDINRAFRPSQMAGGKGSSGVSYSLPIGQGPNRSSGGAFREGIRPVALQPMEARGNVGRGENLYAEATRSIGAMNAGGPAKANLLAAQMRDVDGGKSPEGSFGGPHSATGSSKAGAGGGGPGNKNAYNLGKPWWWDMMQSRSQKMWDLYYYKPREMFWTNLYNVGLGIFNCLLTGDKGGDVSAFFGKSAGDPDSECLCGTKPVIENRSKWLKGSKTTSKNKDGGTDESFANADWETACEKRLTINCPNRSDWHINVKEKSDKNLFQTRAECLGLDVLIDWMKGWVKKEYTANCDAVTVDGINGYTAGAKRKGLFQKEATPNERLSEKAVIALIAKPKFEGMTYDLYPLPTSDNTQKTQMVPNPGYYDGNEYVVKVEHRQQLSMSKAAIDQWNNEHPKCKLSKVISYIPSTLNTNVEFRVNELNGKDDALIDLSDKIKYSDEYCKTGTNKRGAVTFQELKNILHPKKNSVNMCPIPSPEKYVKTMKLNGLNCHKDPAIPYNIDEKSWATATIDDPSGMYVFAVVVEQLTSMSDPIIHDIKSYGLVSKANADKDEEDLTTGYIFKDDKFTFYYESNFAVEGFGSGYSITPNAVQHSSNTTRGDGKIFWIVTSKPNLKKEIQTGDAAFKGKALSQISAKDFVDDYENSGICHYFWCDKEDRCATLLSPKEHCVDPADNNAYISHEIEVSGKVIRIKDEYLGPQESVSTEGLPECPKLCYTPDGKVHTCDNDGKPQDKEICMLNEIPEDYRSKVKPCPDCCKYNGTNYKSVLLNVTGTPKHYIIDATPLEKCNSGNTCDVAAWSQQSEDLIVYDMSTYDEKCLKLIPTLKAGSDVVFATAKGTAKDCPKVTLQTIDNKHFNLIHEQSYTMDPNNVPGDPHFFELFPKLSLPGERDIIDACTFKLTFNYQNASIEPQNPDYQEAAKLIMECINKINTLKATQPELADKYSTLYFHGFASFGGTDYENCDQKDRSKSGQTGAQCNMALSEDRNLFVMDKIAELLEKQDLSIGKEGGNISYNGFTNTNYNGTPAKFPYRYLDRNYNATSGRDITFKSVPYGSDGATPTNKKMSTEQIEDIHAVDRFILININPTATREEAANGYTPCSDSGVCYPSPSRTPYKK